MLRGAKSEKRRNNLEGKTSCRPVFFSGPDRHAIARLIHRRWLFSGSFVRDPASGLSVFLQPVCERVPSRGWPAMMRL